jgi:hypothetical protein
MIRICPILILALLLASCGTERLQVQSEYMLPDRYASVWVGTPDPHKYYPSVGQRLLIQWKLKDEMQSFCQIWLRMRILYRNYEKIEKWIPLKCPVGRIAYYIMDEDYTCTDGIAAYHIQIFGDGRLIAEKKHHLWEEVIIIEQNDEDYDEIDLQMEDFPDDFRFDEEEPDGTGFYRI